jgi:hypothetical protein
VKTGPLGKQGGPPFATQGQIKFNRDQAAINQLSNDYSRIFGVEIPQGLYERMRNSVLTTINEEELNNIYNFYIKQWTEQAAEPRIRSTPSVEALGEEVEEIQAETANLLTQQLQAAQAEEEAAAQESVRLQKIRELKNRKIEGGIPLNKINDYATDNLIILTILALRTAYKIKNKRELPDDVIAARTSELEALPKLLLIQQYYNARQDYEIAMEDDINEQLENLKTPQEKKAESDAIERGNNEFIAELEEEKKEDVIIEAKNVELMKEIEVLEKQPVKDEKTLQEISDKKFDLVASILVRQISIKTLMKDIVRFNRNGFLSSPARKSIREYHASLVKYMKEIPKNLDLNTLFSKKFTGPKGSINRRPFAEAVIKFALLKTMVSYLKDTGLLSGDVLLSYRDMSFENYFKTNENIGPILSRIVKIIQNTTGYQDFLTRLSALQNK